jgi:tetratricopeptide (TPR) repeat protein
LISALLLGLIFSPSILADTVIMTTGSPLEGLIIQETDTHIVLETSAGTMRIPMSRVREIQRGAPWDIQLSRARDVRARGDLIQALAHLNQAREMMLAEGEAETAESVAGVDAQIAELREELDAHSQEIYADLLNATEELERAGRYDEALARIDQAVAQAGAGVSSDTLNRRAAELLVAKARHLRDLVETQRAVVSLRQALERYPDLAEAHRLLGSFLAERDQSDREAVLHLRRAIELLEEDAPADTVINAHALLARCLEASGDHLGASRHWETVSQSGSRLYPRSLSRAVEDIVRWARDLPRTEETTEPLIAELTRAHQLEPHRTEPLNLLGELLQSEGRLPEAIAALEQSIALQHAQPSIHNHLGKIHLDLDDLTAAESELRYAVQYDPNLYIAHCRLAEIHEIRGEFDQAMARAEQAIAVNDRLVRAYVIRGRLHHKRENIPAAKADFEKAIEIQPNNLEPYLEMGRIAIEERDFNVAQSHFESVLNLVEEGDFVSVHNSDNIRAQCHVGLGRIRINRNQTMQALEQFEIARSLDPDYSDIYDALGQAHEENNDYAEAERAYLHAVELNPREANYYYRLGLLYHYRLENSAKAIENYRLALQHNFVNAEEIRQLLRDLRVDPAAL